MRVKTNTQPRTSVLARCTLYLISYCFVQPTGHDVVLSQLFRPLEQRDINLLTYLLTYWYAVGSTHGCAKSSTM